MLIQKNYDVNFEISFQKLKSRFIQDDEKAEEENAISFATGFSFRNETKFHFVVSRHEQMNAIFKFSTF